MKIVISPTKKMKVDTDSYEILGMPVFLTETERIMKWMRSLSLDVAKQLWGCNQKIAEQNFERFSKMDLYKGLTPAILSYEGIQFQYMSPGVFSENALEYINKHLRILSGYYGVLAPMDGITPYRLEMQAKAKIDGYNDLYEFWGDKLYQAVLDDDKVIINLASKEYSKCIEKYLTEDITFITIVFGELINGKVVQKGTMAKMARGEMVRYMAEHGIEHSEQIKNFDVSGYCFKEELSSHKEFVFIKESNTN